MNTDLELSEADFFQKLLGDLNRDKKVPNSLKREHKKNKSLWKKPPKYGKDSKNSVFQRHPHVKAKTAKCGSEEKGKSLNTRAETGEMKVHQKKNNNLEKECMHSETWIGFTESSIFKKNISDKPGMSPMVANCEKIWVSRSTNPSPLNINPGNSKRLTNAKQHKPFVSASFQSNSRNNHQINHIMNNNIQNPLKPHITISNNKQYNSATSSALCSPSHQKRNTLPIHQLPSTQPKNHTFQKPPLPSLKKTLNKRMTVEPNTLIAYFSNTLQSEK